MTKACPLACRHCRATAQHAPLAGELSTSEGMRFLDSLAGFGAPAPVLILTGGDPLARPDFLPLVRHAKSLDYRVALAPAVSDAFSGQILDDLLEAGVRTVSMSLDGAKPETHEGVRQVSAHFSQTLAKISELVGRGYTVQINTTVMVGNAPELAAIAELLHDLRVDIWEVFFLIRVGRGTDQLALSAEQCEDVAHFLYDAAAYGFIVRTVEAPLFRRVVTWRNSPEAQTVDVAEHFGLGSLYRSLSMDLITRLGDPARGRKATTSGTRDGDGILFVGHDGQVLPAGFLPLPLGNVRERSVVDIYRNHPVLRRIRAAEFAGRCGSCEFRRVCGGSRSRAFAETGNPLGEDPACVYQPLPGQPAT